MNNDHEFKKQVDSLYDSLSADDIRAGNEIIRSMGEKKNRLAVEPLIILLKYGDVSIRSNAARALGRIGDKAAVEPLIKSLKDPSALVQGNAAWSLGEIGDERAIEPMELMDVSMETPALMNIVRKSINRIKTRGMVDEKLYLKGTESPEQEVVKDKKTKRQTISPKTGPTKTGISGKVMLAAILITVVILVVAAGAFAYVVMFQPQWSEQLPYKNSTGQYQSVIVYRSATDTTYDNLTRFLDGVNDSLKSAVYDDTGLKCVEYAVLLHDDAQRAQINCSIVGTELSGNTPGHALVAFNTKDRGVVYVDPWSMNVTPGDFGQISIDRIIFLRDKWKQTMPIANTLGQAVSTVENRSSKPVTYDELMAFLKNDTTEKALYVDPEYTCSDFAVNLHDAAEVRGIKCGIVAISFTENNTPGHACNAFPTTDKGIVYIDNTGLNRSEKDNNGLVTDAIVYIKPGQSLGELPANQTGGNLDYGFYYQRKTELEAYSAEWTAYLSDFNYYAANKSHYDGQVEQYNKDKKAYEDHVTEYNNAVSKYNSGSGSYTLDELNKWDIRLENEHSSLDMAYNSLNSLREFLEFWRGRLLTRINELMARDEAKLYINHPVGIVKDVDIFW